MRSALRILEQIPELNRENPELQLAVRAAVHTGEAVVALGARPEEGETFVTGDVVNTASRLQQVAPVGGAVVGEIAYRTTKDVIVYEELEPVAVKGKAEPIAIWRATGARSRFGVDVLGDAGASGPSASTKRMEKSVGELLAGASDLHSEAKTEEPCRFGASRFFSLPQSFCYGVRSNGH